MPVLSELFEQTHCSVLLAKYSHLGKQQAGFFHLEGSWAAIAKLETQLQALNKSHGMVLRYQRTETADYKTAMIPYLVQVIGTDRPTTLPQIIQFFQAQELLPIEYVIQRYHSSHTHTAMVSIQITLLIPADFHLAQIREAFILFCEEHNLDAMFEPDRS